MGMVLRAGVGLDGAQDRQTVHLRHLEVQQHHRRRTAGAALEGPAPAQVIERFGAVVEHHDLVGDPILGKRLERELDVVRVVLDEQYGLEPVHALRSQTGHGDRRAGPVYLAPCAKQHSIPACRALVK